MSCPRGVPGPTRVKSSLSSRVSMILLLCWRAYDWDHPLGQHHHPNSLSWHSTACRETTQAGVMGRGVKPAHATLEVPRQPPLHRGVAVAPEPMSALASMTVQPRHVVSSCIASLCMARVS